MVAIATGKVVLIVGIYRVIFENKKKRGRINFPFVSGCLETPSKIKEQIKCKKKKQYTRNKIQFKKI